MKSNTIVTIVVIGAVLIAAYIVGLLIHRARVADSRSQAAVEANEALIRQETAKLSHEPGTGQTRDTPEARAKLKEKRAEELEKVESATEEQKTQFRKQVRDRFESRPGGKGTPALSVKQPRVAPDPNANTRQNSEKAGSEPNGAGQG